MEGLKQRKYPGRGMIIGTSADDQAIYIVYFIMGRSRNSRNRVFVATEDGLRTEAFVPELLEDPRLIIYHPLRRVGREIIVTNGDQTDTIRDYRLAGKSFVEALESREFEPDAPNWTPRISALIEEDFSFWMSVLKAGDPEGKSCIRQYFHFPSLPGEARFLHTYEEGEDPLKSFAGEPEIMPVGNDFSAFAQGIWTNLNSENRISLYACRLNKQSGEYEEKIINKNVREGL